MWQNVSEWAQHVTFTPYLGTLKVLHTANGPSNQRRWEQHLVWVAPMSIYSYDLGNFATSHGKA